MVLPACWRSVVTRGVPLGQQFVTTSRYWVGGGEDGPSTLFDLVKVFIELAFG
jgi:hypothetical protein